MRCSAGDLQPTTHSLRQDETSSVVTVETRAFLKRLVKGRKRKLFLVVDNLRVHRAKAVAAWAAENSDKIELFYLPTTSIVDSQSVKGAEKGAFPRRVGL